MINLSTDRAIVGRQVIISGAQDMAKWAEENLSRDEVGGFPGKFFFVEKGEINRKRPERK